MTPKFAIAVLLLAFASANSSARRVYTKKVSLEDVESAVSTREDSDSSDRLSDEDSSSGIGITEDIMVEGHERGCGSEGEAENGLADAVADHKGHRIGASRPSNDRGWFRGQRGVEHHGERPTLDSGEVDDPTGRHGVQLYTAQEGPDEDMRGQGSSEVHFGTDGYNGVPRLGHLSRFVSRGQQGYGSHSGVPDYEAHGLGDSGPNNYGRETYRAQEGFKKYGRNFGHGPSKVVLDEHNRYGNVQEGLQNGDSFDVESGCYGRGHDGGLSGDQNEFNSFDSYSGLKGGHGIDVGNQMYGGIGYDGYSGSQRFGGNAVGNRGSENNGGHYSGGVGPYNAHDEFDLYGHLGSGYKGYGSSGLQALGNTGGQEGYNGPSNGYQRYGGRGFGVSGLELHGCKGDLAANYGYLKGGQAESGNLKLPAVVHREGRMVQGPAAGSVYHRQYKSLF